MPKHKPDETPELDEAAEHPRSDGPRAKSRWSWRLRKPQSKVEWILVVTGGLAAVLLLVLAVPYSRYGLLGQLFKRPAVIDVVDSRTHKPVSDVLITLGSQKVKTDAKGEVKLPSVPVGNWQVEANKKYYNLVTSN